MEPLFQAIRARDTEAIKAFMAEFMLKGYKLNWHDYRMATCAFDGTSDWVGASNNFDAWMWENVGFGLLGLLE